MDLPSGSVWDYDAPRYGELAENVDCDVAVIGGGIAGISCAYRLSKAGFDVAVFEAKRIGRGETLGSSAMISYAQDLIYARLIKKHGVNTAQKYLDYSRAAVGEIAGIVEKEKIDCGFRRCESYIYAVEEKHIKALVKEQRAYEKLGLMCPMVRETELPFSIAAAIMLEGQAQFNPYRYVHGLAAAVIKAGGKIYENTRIITQPKGNTLLYGDKKITAKYFIAATHFPYLNLPGFYFFKLFQHRSYNIAYRGGAVLKGMYESADEQGLEFRGIGGGLNNAGGANVRCGKKHNESYYEKVQQRLMNAYGEHINIKYRYSAQDCMTLDDLPLVGRYGIGLENVFVVTGFNKWGMTKSIICADILTDLIKAKESWTEPRLDNIFDTKRPANIMAAPRAVEHVATIAGSWFTSLFSPDSRKLKNIKNGTGGIVRMKGRRLGVYKDENGKVYAIDAVCPHLNCSLKWNPDEKSWDCPCHGSRFDIEGNILTNPSYKNAERIK